MERVLENFLFSQANDRGYFSMRIDTQAQHATFLLTFTAFRLRLIQIGRRFMFQEERSWIIL